MASISERISELKSMVKTKEDIDLLYSLLGTKEIMMNNVVLSKKIKNDGKFHLFFHELDCDLENVGCIRSEIYAYIERRPYESEAEIIEIIDYRPSESVIKEGVTYLEWQDHVVIEDDYSNIKVDEDDAVTKWEHTGDHKDPSYTAYTTLEVYLYFHIDTLATISSLKSGDKIKLFLADLTSDYFAYNNTTCKKCQRKADCVKGCLGHIGVFEDDDICSYQVVIENGVVVLVNDKEDLTLEGLEECDRPFMILKY